MTTDVDSEISLLYRKGHRLAKDRQFKEASKAFLRVLELNRGHVAAALGLAFCMRELGLFDDAQTVLTSALSAVPEDVDLLAEQGFLYDAQNRHDAAIEAFDRALAIAPDNEVLLLSKVESLRKLRRYPDADAVMEDALSRRPNSVPILNEKGSRYFQRGMYDAAATVFDQVLTIDPNDRIAGQMKARLLAKGYGSSQAVEGVFRAAAQGFRGVPRSDLQMHELGRPSAATLASRRGEAEDIAPWSGEGLWEYFFEGKLRFLIGLALAVAIFYPFTPKLVLRGELEILLLLVTGLPTQYPPFAIGIFLAFIAFGFVVCDDWKKHAYVATVVLLLVHWLPGLQFGGEAALFGFVLAALWPFALLIGGAWLDLIFLFLAVVVGGLIGEGIRGRVEEWRGANSKREAQERL